MLIESCLSSLPMYMMGLYTLPEGIHASFDKELSRFFWQGSDGRQKYHMVKWADLCTPKDRGGIGILSSRKMNKALMLRWVWRILREEGDYGYRSSKQNTSRVAPSSRVIIRTAPNSGEPSKQSNMRSVWVPTSPSGMGRAPSFGTTRGWMTCP